MGRKQHGHSIATMLRAYAAWAEGAAEVDVEAIKRSMNEEKLPTAIILAADLSLASAIHTRGAPASVLACAPRAIANPLSVEKKAEKNEGKIVWLGWQDYSARDGPHPFGAAPTGVKPTNI
jgi:hypothetical protein